MSQNVFIFAVIQEAKPFLRGLRQSGQRLETLWHQNIPILDPAWSFQGGQVWVSGMGQKHASELMEGLLCHSSDVVYTCGFAGGLNPKWATGDVLYHVDPEMEEVEYRLRRSGASPAHFACESRVAVNREEKAALFHQNQQDAVEMESGVVREVCRRRGIRSATVRVISDAAHEDLPLDFNRLMTPDMRIDGARLALRLIGKPGKIAELIRFQSRLKLAAKRLADVLMTLTSP